MTEEAAQRTVRIEACLFLLAPEGFLAIGMGLTSLFRHTRLYDSVLPCKSALCGCITAGSVGSLGLRVQLSQFLLCLQPMLRMSRESGRPSFSQCSWARVRIAASCSCHVGFSFMVT